MARRQLFVFAHLAEGFIPAGRILLAQERSLLASSFTYDQRYLRRRGRFELDPVSLSLENIDEVRGVELFPKNGLTQFGGIRDAAPDAWGRRVIEVQRQSPAYSLIEADYLLAAGSERVGALDVRAALNSAPLQGASDVRLLGNLLEGAQRIEAGAPIPNHLSDIFAAGAGAGGARPKATVRDETNLLWLAKFPSHVDVFDVPRAEYCTLKLGQRCGLTVPEVDVIQVAGKSVMLIRRFDRYWHRPEQALDPTASLHETKPGEGQAEGRLPFVSGWTLIACDDFESRLKGYADLAHAVRRYGHPDLIRQDTEELFARMIFNIFVSNEDDHLRNHGFIRDPRFDGWRLSPLYDVVPRPEIAQERFLQLEVGSQGKRATLDNAMSGFSAFTPERPQAISIVRRVWGQVRQWKTHFEKDGASFRLIERLAPAFRNLDDICSPALRAEIRRAD